MDFLSVFHWILSDPPPWQLYWIGWVGVLRAPFLASSSEAVFIVILYSPWAHIKKAKSRIFNSLLIEICCWNIIYSLCKYFSKERFHISLLVGWAPRRPEAKAWCGIRGHFHWNALSTLDCRNLHFSKKSYFFLPIFVGGWAAVQGWPGKKKASVNFFAMQFSLNFPQEKCWFFPQHKMHRFQDFAAANVR